MGGFYSNLAIVAALICGISLATFISPHDKLMENMDVSHPWLWNLFGMSGVFGFTFGVGTAMDCILIDNSLRQAPGPVELLFFFEQSTSFLALPAKLFMVSMTCVLVQVVVIAYALFPPLVFWSSLIGALVLGMTLLRRYGILTGLVLQMARMGNGSAAGYSPLGG